MRAATNRPRVFLSSTVYDFADLRSALKVWLEELGYDVDASEFNDFDKDSGDNSYDACLAAIDKADYFLLLIGGRAGGWSDKGSKTTITMMEYRRAYERAKRGELKILAFVRQTVWDLREDGRALLDHLNNEYAKEHGLAQDAVAELAYHRSRAIENAEVIFEFLSEVARTKEMRATSQNGGERPAANWVHRFDGFREIVDALRVELAGSVGLRHVALTANLRFELQDNLRTLLRRIGPGRLRPAYEDASPARADFRGEPDDHSLLKGTSLPGLGDFVFTRAELGDQLRTQFLDEALVSGEFLEFDRSLDRYVVGPVQHALVALKDEILRLRKQAGIYPFPKRWELIQLCRQVPPGQRPLSVSNHDLVWAMSMHDRQANIVALSCSLLRALDGDPAILNKLSLRPTSPFEEQAFRIAAKAVTTQEVLAWVTATTS